MEIKDYLLIIFGAFIGSLSFIIKDCYISILNYHKEQSNFNQIVKSYKTLIEKLKKNIENNPGRVLELRCSNSLYLCSFGGRKAEPIIDGNTDFDAESFLANLYSFKFIYIMDLDTSGITTGSAFSSTRNRTVKYVLADNFINKINIYKV